MIEGVADVPVEFLDDVYARSMEFLADPGERLFHEVFERVDVHAGKFVGRGTAYAPYIADRKGSEVWFGVSGSVKDKCTVMCRMFFGDFVGHFCECFGGANTNGDRNACPFCNGLLGVVYIAFDVFYTTHVGKGFVDRVDR